mmetsp:Transcript_23064/g.64474  ORF Transcript_23064/g.64474 Transcript_23064/m.64474 type:complete len:332 (-) Transcript_23064:1166-2161(-)
MSFTSSIENMSTSTAGSSSSFSSSLSSSCFSASFVAASSFAFAFFASAAFLEGSDLNSFSRLCQSCKIFCHSAYFSWNHGSGSKCSTRVVIFFCRIQALRWSLHFSSSCHSKTTSLKPSSSSGTEYLGNDSTNAAFVKSLTRCTRNHCFFSSSVSSSSLSSSSSSSSSSSFSSFFSGSCASSFLSPFPSSFSSPFLSPSFISSSSFFTSSFISSLVSPSDLAPSPASPAPSFALAGVSPSSLTPSSSTCILSPSALAFSFFRSTAVFFPPPSAPAAARFFSSSSAWRGALNSSEGSPSMTRATRRKCCSPNRLRSCSLSLLIRFALTSITM